MQFVSDGPDISERLLQAQEEGRVVFFCGAGISYAAGLPGFAGLVDGIYKRIGEERTPIEEEAYSWKQYDATLDLLGHRVPGGRLAVRRALANILKPKLGPKDATSNHSALLELAKNRQGGTRLVTTNFDRIFAHVIRRDKLKVTSYFAPSLPIPKSRWNGLVYLHGILPRIPDDESLNRLVITSGDFGLAYLTERWAARFVSELFRNYTVCFVGYSINDPVLRYMMDALAADRMLGEHMPEAYAFADCEPGQEDVKTIEWKAKGVTPILYQVQADSYDHWRLNKTITAWADTYRDGIGGREAIIAQYAKARPALSTKQEDFVGRVLWALTHASGLPAGRFADFTPVPSLEWLEALTEGRFHQGDLIRFGVHPNAEINEKLQFSLINRPSPYTHSPWMNLVSRGTQMGGWDNVMEHLARWLTRHLNDPKLALWVANNGGYTHPSFRRVIEQRLELIEKLEFNGQAQELLDLATGAPNAIPSQYMRTIWRLFILDRIKTYQYRGDLYGWVSRFQRSGLTDLARLELRELLAPKIVLREPLRLNEIGDAKSDEYRTLDIELVLASDHPQTPLRTLIESSKWPEASKRLADDLQQLLREALDLLQGLDPAKDHRDLSIWHLPSISPHRQNRHHHEWVSLIELLRDSWLAIYADDIERAQQIVESWRRERDPVFIRLALFAASHDGVVPTGAWVDWLTRDDGRWLWSESTRRETMRLIVLQAGNLSRSASERLQSAILNGPPRQIGIDDLANEEGANIDQSIWIRLAKLATTDATLSSKSRKRLKELSDKHSQWRLSENEQDEFSVWMSGTGDPDYQSRRQIDVVPSRRRALIHWLEHQPPRTFFYEDTWQDACRDNFPVCVVALFELARRQSWPTSRWREALYAWSNEKLAKRSWRVLAQALRDMPDQIFYEAVPAISGWLEAVAKTPTRHQDIFINLCGRILAKPFLDVGDDGEDVMAALNHSVGRTTQALLNLWFQRKPEDREGLPVDLRPLFNLVGDRTSEILRHGRVILASNLIALYRVDQAWTESNLLPLFNWDSFPTEARALWQGFLWSPRIHWPLLAAMKSDFLACARQYAALGEYARQYTALSTYIALDSSNVFSASDFRKAFAQLPQEGLREVLQTIIDALDAAGEQRSQNWNNRVIPFWNQVWPKSIEMLSSGIADDLAKLAIAAREEFPSAVSLFKDWLQPVEYPHYVVYQLHHSGLPARFPQEALTLLSLIIANQPWAPDELVNCLEAIERAWPDAVTDWRFIKLQEYVRKRNL